MDPDRPDRPTWMYLGEIGTVGCAAAYVDINGVAQSVTEREQNRNHSSQSGYKSRHSSKVIELEQTQLRGKLSPWNCRVLTPAFGEKKSVFCLCPMPRR